MQKSIYTQTSQNISLLARQRLKTPLFIEMKLAPAEQDKQVEPVNPTILQTARKVVLSEMKALQALFEVIDDRLEQAARLIQRAGGRVVVTGVGKSGHIGRKIAATLASTGTPAFFMHADEGVHGDLGMITADDVVLVLSYSGGTEETLKLVQPIYQIGAKLIAITGRPDSALGQWADVTLEIGVREEADPLDLAPTNSTTAMLVLGDALAIALSVDRQFSREDFGRHHPGSSLVRQLRQTARDITKGRLLTPSPFAVPPSNIL
jgi:arabinose-5-phosphate isomerase